MITTNKAISYIDDIKNKILSVIGDFLKNGDKLSQMRSFVSNHNIPDKERLIQRIDFLSQRQDSLLKESNDLTNKMDALKYKLLKYKDVDLTLLGFRSVEVIGGLIKETLSLVGQGKDLLEKIYIQNKDVYNLEQYISKSTREGFKFELPKLEDITKPISDTAKYIGIAVGGLAVLFLFFRYGRR